MKRFTWLIFALFLTSSFYSEGGNFKRLRGLVLFDMKTRNNEKDSSSLFVAKQILNSAGIPYCLTSDLDSAMRYQIIMLSSDILSNSFTQNEFSQILNFVEAGGVFIASNIGDVDCYGLFGIKGVGSSKFNHRINWVTDPAQPELKWLNDTMETTVSLAAKGYDSLYYTKYFHLATAFALARYENDSVAVIRNAIGTGFAYAFGNSFSQSISRSEFNYDYEAERVFVNGFEPSADVNMLVIRGIYEFIVKNPVIIHSAPYDKKYCFVMTHDVATEASMDSILYFAQWEEKTGIISTWFVSTRYFDDSSDWNSYDPNVSKIAVLPVKNQIIGSHSVGNFPDFDKEAIFPKGSMGNSRTTYHPFYNNSSTVGGTVFGECEVSKKMLESDFSTTVVSFRVPDNLQNNFLIDVLDTLGYLYNSSCYANDLMTNFPFMAHKQRKLSGPSTNVMEIPVSFVFDRKMGLLNWQAKATEYLTTMNRIYSNEAPVIGSLKTDFLYKLDFEKYLLSHLPDSTFVMSIESFGDFWRYRQNVNFRSEVRDSLLTMYIPDKIFPLDFRISFIVKDAQNLKNIVIKSESGMIQPHYSVPIAKSDLLIYFKRAPLNLPEDNTVQQELIVYPNPFSNSIRVSIPGNTGQITQIQLFSLDGRIVYSKADCSNNSDSFIDLSIPGLDDGLYILKTQSPNGVFTQKLIKSGF